MALRKKFCLKLPAIFADEYDNRGIRDYNGESLAGAAHTEFGEDGYDIMVIDLFRDGELVGRYFADKVTSEHKGWDVKAKRWYQKIRLDNLAAAVLSLPTGYSHDDWRDDPYSIRGADHEKIHDFFGYSISAWENDAESKLYTRRINRHEELTRQWVAKWYVDPDEAFRDWAVSLVRIPAAIGRKIDGEVQYACTCCGKRWTRKKFYRSGHKVECPECGAKLKPVRESTANVAWTTEVRVYRAAPGKDGKGWFLEMLYSFGRFDIEEGTWSFRLSPHIMTHLEQGEHYGRCYYAFTSGWSDKKSDFNIFFREGLLYPHIGAAEPYMDEDQARRLRAIGETYLSCNVDRAVMLSGCPQLEYLIKGGYKKLSKQLIDTYRGRLGNVEGMTADEFFGFNRQRQNRLRQMNGGVMEVKWLRWEERTGKKISDEDIRWYAKKTVSPDQTFSGWAELLKRLGSPRKARNYAEKQAAISGRTVNAIANDYLDYINMAKKLRYNLAHEIFYKPKDLETAHDECVRVIREQKWEIQARGVEEKFPEVNGILESITDKYEYIGDEYRIVVPKGIVDILKEGQALGHCVDTSDRYFERIEQRTTYIVFLRKNDCPEQPYYTLEIQPSGTVRQQRTTGNMKNKEQVEAYRPFILEWQKEVRKRLTAEDRKLDKESDRIRIEEYKDLRERKELIHRGMLAGTLLVDALEGDLIVSAV